MLSKRGRAPIMKRTTSMTGMNVDQPWPSDHHSPWPEELRSPVGVPDGHIMMGSTWNDHPSPAMMSPRYSGDRRCQETSPFLRTCGLCNRRLAPSRDIYMYRGDTAFCSEECREQQIKQDERKEKCTMGKPKKVENYHNPSDLTCESSSNGETVAAA